MQIKAIDCPVCERLTLHRLLELREVAGLLAEGARLPALGASGTVRLLACFECRRLFAHIVAEVPTRFDLGNLYMPFRKDRQ